MGWSIDIIGGASFFLAKVESAYGRTGIFKGPPSLTEIGVPFFMVINILVQTNEI